MNRSEPWLERTIERIEILTHRLILSGSWWRRYIGIAIGSSAICCIIPILALWLLFGKKPAGEPPGDAQ